MDKRFKTHYVLLRNGEKRLIIEHPDNESRHNSLFSPKKLNGESYGVVFDSLETATEFIFQWECEHNVVPNDVVTDKFGITPLPYKCTKCAKHFVYWKNT